MPQITVICPTLETHTAAAKALQDNPAWTAAGGCDVYQDNGEGGNRCPCNINPAGECASCHVVTEEQKVVMQSGWEEFATNRGLDLNLVQFLVDVLLPVSWYQKEKEQ